VKSSYHPSEQSGKPFPDAAFGTAIEAIRKSRWQPGRKNDRPVATRVQQEIAFKN